MTDQEPKYLIVHTAKQIPTWMSWGTYALIVVNTYYADTGNNWFLYGVSAVALGMTYLFYTTYRATVNMYNDKIVSAAIAEHYPDAMKGTMKVDTSFEAATMMEITIERYADTLHWINEKCTSIGNARDRAWRALNHNEITQSVKNNAAPKEANDESDGT